MVDQEDDDKATPPRLWLGKWLRDENFWREMFTLVLSGSIVLAVGGVGALAAGIGTHQQRIHFALGAIGTLIAVLALFGFFGKILSTLHIPARTPSLSTRRRGKCGRKDAADTRGILLKLLRRVVGERSNGSADAGLKKKLLINNCKKNRRSPIPPLRTRVTNSR